MNVVCPRCGHALDDASPETVGASESECPRCGAAVPLMAMTMPLQDQAAIPTIQRARMSEGELDPNLTYSLVVVSGNQPGKIYPIRHGRVTIGRVDCDVNLDDRELSRQHALISIRGTSATLEDLGSTNGTFLDDRRIDRAQLSDRTEFRVGNHQFLFVMSDRDDPL